VWSAPNYGNAGNLASVLILKVEGREEFNLPIFEKEEKVIQEDQIPFDPSSYFAETDEIDLRWNQFC
jgi:hypothetical protein